MSLDRYVEGVAMVALVVTCAGVTSVSLRRRWLQEWTGPSARLAELVLGLSVVILIAQVLGTFGLFRLIPYGVALVVVALISYRFGWHALTKGTEPDSAGPTNPAVRRETWAELIAAVVSTALLLAEWSGGTVAAFRGGMTNVDSLWYHMPIAARFVQEGSVSSPPNIGNDNAIAFYPASSELVHAIGIMLLGTDVLSPLLNVGWLALALYSGWCLGKRFGVGSLTVMAVALAFGTTEMVADEPGGAYNDVVGIALVLAALALIAYVHGLWDSHRSFQGLLIAAVAAGLAMGVKYTFLFPVAALTLGVIFLLPRGYRVRRGMAWCLVVAGSGGYWYLRNLVYAGNPFPNVHLGLGSLRLPSPTSPIALTFVHFLFDGAAWRAYFLPGLASAFGPAWWAILAAASVGLVVALVGNPTQLWGYVSQSGFDRREQRRTVETRLSTTRDSFARLMAFGGVATLLGYLVTPQPLLPNSFVYDARFALLSILLGLAALPVVLSGSRWVIPLLPTYGVLIVATQLAGGIWSGAQGIFSQGLVAYHSVSDGLLVGLPFLVVGVALVVARRCNLTWLTATIGSLVAVFVLTCILAGFALQTFYLAHRYQDGPQFHTDRWANSVHHARIADSGLIYNYPLYGSDLTNQVEFVGTALPHGAFAPITNCSAWRRAINRGHYQFVVSAQDVSTDGKALPSASTWTATDPAAKLIVSDTSPDADGYERISVFAIHGNLQPSLCRGR